MREVLLSVGLLIFLSLSLAGCNDDNAKAQGGNGNTVTVTDSMEYVDLCEFSSGFIMLPAICPEERILIGGRCDADIPASTEGADPITLKGAEQFVADNLGSSVTGIEESFTCSIICGESSNIISGTLTATAVCLEL